MKAVQSTLRIVKRMMVPEMVFAIVTANAWQQSVKKHTTLSRDNALRKDQKHVALGLLIVPLYPVGGLMRAVLMANVRLKVVILTIA